VGRKKQQGNGSGSVYPRKNKDGKITSYLGAYHTTDGKRRTVSAKTKTECREKLRQAMSDADKGIVFDAGTLTLNQYLDSWLSNIKDTIRQRTWERYESIVRIHIRPALGNVKLKNLTRAHVKNLYGTLGSPRHPHITLHKALNDAVADNLISRNVSDGLKPPKPRKSEINPLTPDQAKAFLEAARGDTFYALYVLAVHYGLRQGELLGLKWQDVDLDAGTLQVRRTQSESRVGRIEEKPKNGRGRRIELSDSVSEVLRIHGETHGDHELVFATKKGTAVNSSNLVRRSFQPLLDSCGLPRIRFHDLRHTCATIRFIKGQHPKRVSDILGHSSVAITLDIYSHVIPGMGDDEDMFDGYC
jgi:integrase